MGATSMIPQNKGKDLHKIAPSKVPTGPFFCSKKYDGFYIQVRYHPVMGVAMWTSGNKRFHLHELADYISQTFNEPFHIEAEFNFNCSGYLGDRGKSAILTTYRTNTAKGIISHGEEPLHFIRVLDRLDDDRIAKFRIPDMVEMFSNKLWFHVPEFHTVDTIEEAEKITKLWVKHGYEGSMLKELSHTHQPGKRTNDIVKLKPRKTADLLCVGWIHGEQSGKYADAVGSLCLRDKAGNEVYAGSGLTDDMRWVRGDEYIGKVIEIQYERLDDTYIQPIIKAVRYDKEPGEID